MSNYSLTDRSNLTGCSDKVNMTFVGDIEGKGVSVSLRPTIPVSRTCTTALTFSVDHLELPWFCVLGDFLSSRVLLV